jgi:hypothetical protein
LAISGALDTNAFAHSSGGLRDRLACRVREFDSISTTCTAGTDCVGCGRCSVVETDARALTLGTPLAVCVAVAESDPF